VLRADLHARNACLDVLPGFGQYKRQNDSGAKNMEEIMKKANKKTTAVTVKAKAGRPKANVVKTKPAVVATADTMQKKQARQGSKQSIIISMLKDSKGATVAELAEATGWQKHSVQGAMSGSLKKKLGLTIASEKDDKRGRVYRIA